MLLVEVQREHSAACRTGRRAGQGKRPGCAWAVKTAKTGLSGKSRTFVGRHCTGKREIAGDMSAPSNTGHWASYLNRCFGLIAARSRPVKECNQA